MCTKNNGYLCRLFYISYSASFESAIDQRVGPEENFAFPPARHIAKGDGVLASMLFAKQLAVGLECRTMYNLLTPMTVLNTRVVVCVTATYSISDRVHSIATAPSACTREADCGAGPKKFM